MCDSHNQEKIKKIHGFRELRRSTILEDKNLPPFELQCHYCFTLVVLFQNVARFLLQLGRRYELFDEEPYMTCCTDAFHALHPGQTPSMFV